MTQAPDDLRGLLQALLRGLGDFRTIGDDYGGVEIVCRRCTEQNVPWNNRRQMKIGYTDPESAGTVADLVRLCLEHTHQPESE